MNLELFLNFYNSEYKEGKLPERLHDTPLGHYVILRSNSQGNTIHYLDKGARFFIPLPWIDIFSAFYLLHDNELNDNEDNIEKFIFLFTKLQEYHVSQFSKLDGNIYLDLLGDIGKLGTKTFRDKVNIDKLTPFFYKSPNTYIEL